MSRGQRTNKDLQKSSPKSDLSVLENLFSHNREQVIAETLILCWVFGVIVPFFLYRKNCWPSQFTFSFHYYHSHSIGE
jgi:hypothetical protein